MGINGDVQHKLMSLHISSIETLNKPAHIFVYFFFVCCFCWFEKKNKIEKKNKKTRDAKRSENNAQRGQTKCLFGFDDHRFHMFTDDMRSGERVGPLKPPLTWSLFSSFM